MKLKLDENIPVDLVQVLAAIGHEADTVSAENICGCSDDELWAVVQHESRFLITQDMDFSDIRKFAPGSHHGILLIRLRTPDRASLVQRVEELFRQEDVPGWTGCFVVASERKIRIQRAQT
jgi:predicted nuclease of predicted toxin-antitoxin system